MVFNVGNRLVEIYIQIMNFYLAGVYQIGEV